MSHLELSVDRLENKAGWAATWKVDGQSVGRRCKLVDQVAASIHTLDRDFAKPFEIPGMRPVLPAATLDQVGKHLFRCWFTSAWKEHLAAPINNGSPCERAPNMSAMRSP